MASMANIVVNDAQSTPVAHTFIPVNLDASGIASWEERSSSYSIGFFDFTLKTKRPKMSDSAGVYRTILNLRVPVVQEETVNGIVNPKVVRYAIARTELIMPANSTLQERKDARKYLVGILDNSQILDVVESLGSPRA